MCKNVQWKSSLYNWVPQIFPWSANLLQSLAPTLIKLKTLISMLRCVWLRLEQNSAGVGRIWGCLLSDLCPRVLCFHMLPVFPCPYLVLRVPVFIISSLVSVCEFINSLFFPSRVPLIIMFALLPCSMFPCVQYNKGYCVWWTTRLLVLSSYGLWQKTIFLFSPFFPRGMETVRFAALARIDLPFCVYAREFCKLAMVTTEDYTTINQLFWLGANYNRPMDLQDTTGLSSREGVFWCLGSVRSGARISPPLFAAHASPPAVHVARLPVTAPSKPESALLEHPQVSALPELPQVSALPEHPQVFASPERPQVSALPEHPQVSALPELPQVSALPEHPQVFASPERPQVSALPELPQVSALPEHPQVFASPERPQVSAFPEHPQVSALPERPPKPAPRQHPPEPAPW